MIRVLRKALPLLPLLAVFWLVLSGHYTALLLSLGLASVLLVGWLMHRVEAIDGIEIRTRPSLRAPLYAGWLVVAVLKSSVSVLCQVWSLRSEPSPTVGTTTVADLSEVGTVVYANSITLTPGTLSLSLDDDGVEVHALEESGLADLREGEMLNRVRRAGAR